MNSLYTTHIAKNRCAKTPPSTHAKSEQKTSPFPTQDIDYQSLIPNPQKIKSAQFFQQHSYSTLAQ